MLDEREFQEFCSSSQKMASLFFFNEFELKTLQALVSLSCHTKHPICPHTLLVSGKILPNYIFHGLQTFVRNFLKHIFDQVIPLLEILPLALEIKSDFFFFFFQHRAQIHPWALPIFQPLTSLPQVYPDLSHHHLHLHHQASYQVSGMAMCWLLH